MLTPLRKGADYHHGDLKHAAILAARKLVSAKGLTGLGIRTVADRIGVTPPAMYRHFESLEELRIELSAHVRDELADLMTQRRDRASKSKSRRQRALDRFEAIGEAYVDYARENPRLFEIAFMSCSDDFIDESSSRSSHVLQQAIAELEEVGLLEVKAKALAPMIAWSSVHGLATLVAQGAISQREYARALREVFEGVQRAILKRRSSQ